MKFYFYLPFIFLKFWLIEAPYSILLFFKSLNKSFLKLISLPLLIHTFFKPWKNEYREGLVGFSIGMGIFIKSVVILADLTLLLVLLFFETFSILLFFTLPFVLIGIIFL